MSDSDKETNNKADEQPKVERKIANKKEGIMMASGYILGWVIFIIIFKIVYGRYRKAQKKRKDWFGRHAEKETYEELLVSNPDDEEGLRKALMRRALTDMRRYMELSQEKESVYNLMRSGAISEAMWEDFKEAEAKLQLEIFDLQAEAETFKKGWSQGILKEAAVLLSKERELTEMKKAKEAEERRQKDMEKKMQKQREHEERLNEEQEEKARKVRERLLAEAEQALKSKPSKSSTTSGK